MNKLVLLESNVIKLNPTEEELLALDFGLDYDTVAEDPSGMFKEGDTYTIEKWEEYNLSFEDWKLRKLNEVKSKSEGLVDSVIQEYPEFERLTFTTQSTEAEELMSNPSVSTPFLSMVASLRNISVSELAARVLNHRNNFAMITSYAAGKRQAYLDQIESCTTAAELNTIEVSFSLEELTQLQGGV